MKVYDLTNILFSFSFRLSEETVFISSGGQDGHIAIQKHTICSVTSSLLK